MNDVHGYQPGSPPLMPAAFIGHASPRITLRNDARTEAWKLFAASIPRPRAILVISALPAMV